MQDFPGPEQPISEPGKLEELRQLDRFRKKREMQSSIASDLSQACASPHALALTGRLGCEGKEDSS